MAMFLGSLRSAHPQQRLTTRVIPMGDEIRVVVYLGKKVIDTRVFDTKQEVTDFLASLNLNASMRGLGCACGM
jgi:hypothetical protein